MVKQTRFDNGATLLTDRRDGYESATLGCWINVGSAYEPAHLSGLTHCIEHLVFRGGRQHQHVELDQSGGHLNAFTDKEQTCFFGRVMGADVPSTLRTLLRLIADVPFDPTLLEAEKRVILEEIRSYDDNPHEVMAQWLSEAALEPHPLARSSLGTAASLAAIRADDLREHWNAFYQTANLVVTAAGQVEHEALVDMVASLPARGAPGVPPPPPASFGQRHERRLRPSEPAWLCLGGPGLGQRDARNYAMALLDVWLANLLAAPDRQTYAAMPLHQSYADTGIFGILAACGSDRLGQTTAWIQNILDTMLSRGIDDETLRRCGARLKSSLCLALESTEARMIRLAKNLLYHGRDISLDELARDVDGVTAEQVQAVARQVFAPARLSRLVLGP
jgi:predicted Zn-dependent peptidase